jgi:hypothetical protein
LIPASEATPDSGQWIPRSEVAALGWAAEHAVELGADAQLLAVAGVHLGGAHAARLATTTRDQGWPQLSHQLLVHPTFGPACPTPPDVGGLPPATIITTDPPDEQTARYAARLRAAGVGVEELHLRSADFPSELQLSQIVDSLRRGVPGAAASERFSTGHTSNEFPSDQQSRPNQQ